MSDRQRNSWLIRFVHECVASRPGTWLYLNVFPHVDRPLLRLSRGRLSVSLGHPVLLLTTIGAKTGQPRSTPLVYAADGENVILIASNGGQSWHPAWYYNLRKCPEATLTLRGRTARYRAREATGEEREALWQKALDVYSGYATYQERAGKRLIPILILSPIRES
jgi:deazaflavin-dependent oxidoreductase (nitroreductase family)